MTKAHVLKCAAYNLGLLLRKVFGLAKPRSGAAGFELIIALWRVLVHCLRSLANGSRIGRRIHQRIPFPLAPFASSPNAPVV